MVADSCSNDIDNVKDLCSAASSNLYAHVIFTVRVADKLMVSGSLVELWHLLGAMLSRPHVTAQRQGIA